MEDIDKNGDGKINVHEYIGRCFFFCLFVFWSLSGGDPVVSVCVCTP